MTSGPDKLGHAQRLQSEEWFFILLIVVASLLLKLAFLGSDVLVFDEATHVMIAKYFVLHGFSWTMERMIGSTFPPTQYYAMGWTWLLSNWLGLNVSEETIFRIPSVIMSCLTIPFIYVLARRLSRNVAIVASTTFAFLPYVVAYSRLAIMDLPALFWLTVGIYCYLRSLGADNQRPWLSSWLWLAGTFFGIAAFTKVYFGFVFLAVFFHRALVNHAKYGRAWKLSVANIMAYSLPVLASMTAVVLLISLIVANNPSLIYLMYKDTVNSEFYATLGSRPSVPTVLYTHLGLGIFAISLVGLALLFYRQRKIDEINSFYGILVVVYAVVFLPFLYARYLLIMTPALCIAFGYGIVWIYKTLKPKNLHRVFELKSIIALFVFGAIAILVLSEFQPLMNIYGAKVIDDYWVCDSLRDVGKLIQQNANSSDWTMTNGPFNVIRYYSEGIDTELYQGGSDTGSMNVYWIYHDGTPAVTTQLNADEESHLRYFVLVSNYTVIPSHRVLFSEDLAFSWVKPDDFLNYYLQTYFQPKIEFTEEDGITVRVYERTTDNVFSSMQNPSVYVGEPGAVSGSKFINWNGFITGNGWSDPYAVEVNGTNYWIRNASSNNQGEVFSSCVLDVREPEKDAALNVTYLDRGFGSRIISTVYNATIVNGEENFLTREIGQVNLNDTGMIKTVKFVVPSSEYYDVSNTTQGLQQLFGIYADENTLPLVKLELVSG